MSHWDGLPGLATRHDKLRIKAGKLRLEAEKIDREADELEDRYNELLSKAQRRLEELLAAR